MSASKFKFISPGVFLEEIDKSRLPAEQADVGPLIIGRSERGPGMRPISVRSFQEFTEVFGEPIPGGTSGDVWRDGNYTSPTYAAYAAKAFLKNGGPVTFLRLMGTEDAQASTTDDAQAGWNFGTISNNGGAATNDSTDPQGAYGLFVAPLGNPAADTEATGTLAAVFYANPNSVDWLTFGLRGTTNLKGASLTLDGHAGIVKSDTSGNFLMAISSGVSAENLIEFNFDRNSEKFIRKVFNTDPTKTNSNIHSATEKYFLGETYETLNLFPTGSSVNSSAQMMGFVAGLAQSAATGGTSFGINQQEASAARSGWVFSQNIGSWDRFDPASSASVQKLFRLHAVEEGTWPMRNLKISIENVKPPKNSNVDPFGRFSLVVRNAKDNDNKPEVLERFDNLDLNPDSMNYIARRIGDAYAQWDSTNRRLVFVGEFENMSNYIRVEVSPAVSNGSANEDALPFGFEGPPSLMPIHLLSSATNTAVYTVGINSGNPHGPPGRNGPFHNNVADTAAYMSPGSDLGNVTLNNGGGGSNMTQGAANKRIAFGGNTDGLAPDALTGICLRQPVLRCRVSSSAGGLQPTKAYFGVDNTVSVGSKEHNQSYVDYLRKLPGSLSDSNLHVSASFFFTMDDICPPTAGGNHASQDLVWHSGSGGQTIGSLAGIAAGTGGHQSYSRASGSFWITGSVSRNIPRVKGFTMPMFGGFDGWDIKESDPLRQDQSGQFKGISTDTNESNSVYQTVKRAIDTVADPEFAEYNTLMAPGITNASITDHMITTCENRADALAIVDIPNLYMPKTWSTDDYMTRKKAVTVITGRHKARALNSSYGAAYAPWIGVPISGRKVWMPPSVAVAGVLAHNDKVAGPWFSPAGYNRGNLSDGAAGISVTGLTHRFDRSDRDELYALDINPIADFANEGITVFGQKTLQKAASALDRINVRRLMLFIKRRVSFISSRLLFDNNVEATWNRFLSQVNPLLGSIRQAGGLTDFRVVLDDSTTTPDMIDRNIMYAKIFLKPARAVEFIAIDFVITRSGASFDD